MNLESVSQLVAQHSSQSLSQAQNKIVKAEQERAMLKLMVQRIMWGMLVVGLGIVLLVINKSFGLPFLGLFSSLLMLGGTGLALYGVLAALRDGVAISGARLPLGIPEPTDVTSLPTQRVPLSVPSVTERTTQLIAREGLPEIAQDDLHQDVSKTRE
jgi:hypothetical protein